MKFTVHGGHTAQGQKYSGAAGLCFESVEDRLIKDAVIKYLQAAGHTAYDCTVDAGISQSDVIAKIKSKINSYGGVTANISVHLNCYNGSAKGTECEVYANSGAAGQTAARISSRIAALGFVNRGVKTRADLGVLKGITNGGANVLVETFFCDSRTDYDRYKAIGGAEAVGKAIAEGVLNQTIAVEKTNIQEALKMGIIVLQSLTGDLSQRWRPIHNKDGSKTLINAKSGLALDVPGGSAKSGTALQTYQPNGTISQKFTMSQVGGNYAPSFVAPVYLSAGTNKNLAVDCVNGGTANNTRVQTYSKNLSKAQLWGIVDCGDGTWVLINTNSLKALTAA